MVYVIDMWIKFFVLFLVKYVLVKYVVWLVLLFSILWFIKLN